jgi:hypothetical protein
VFTHEQDWDLSSTLRRQMSFAKAQNLANIASFNTGVGYGKWTHIDGWSESVIEYIRALKQTAWVNLGRGG